jgi:hypothetical protein
VRFTIGDRRTPTSIALDQPPTLLTRIKVEHDQEVASRVRSHAVHQLNRRIADRQTTNLTARSAS